mgnify:CR=1 FL=1
MGKLLLFFSVLFISLASFCQQKKGNELSLSFFKISTFYYQDIFIQKLPFKDFSGINISYKKQIKPALFLRASASHYKQNFNSPDPNALSSCYDCNPTKITVNESYLNFGIERRKIKSQSKKIGFYSGVDITLFYFNTKGIIDGWSAFKSVKQTIKGAGVQPFIGFRTCLFKRMSLSMESSLLLGGAKSYYFTKGVIKPFKESVHKEYLIYGQFNFLRLLSFNYEF